MRFSRFLPVILLLVISVPLLAFSVGAVDDDQEEFFNYRQYIQNVTVDGTNDIVTVNVPMDMASGNIAAGDWTTLATWQGSTFSGYQTSGEGYYHAMVYPFGEDYLSLRNIPDDADYRLTFYVTGFTNPDKDTVQYIRLFERYVAGDTIYRPMRYVNYGTPTDDSYLLSVEDSFASGYDGFSPEFDVYFYSSGSTTLSVDLVSFEIVLTISSYYRALDEMGYSEQIDELKQELAEQNKKLDDFLEYEPDNSPPPEQEQLDKVEDAEDQLMGSVNDGFNEAYDLFDSVHIFLGSLQPALLAIASILGVFIGLDTSGVPGFYVLVSISMALGTLGVLLSIGSHLSKSDWTSKGKGGSK